MINIRSLKVASVADGVQASDGALDAITFCFYFLDVLAVLILLYLFSSGVERMYKAALGGSKNSTNPPSSIAFATTTKSVSSSSSSSSSSPHQTQQKQEKQQGQQKAQEGQEASV